jgi:hypothetical protein
VSSSAFKIPSPQKESRAYPESYARMVGYSEVIRKRRYESYDLRLSGIA